jgi:hypothetical protein
MAPPGPAAPARHTAEKDTAKQQQSNRLEEVDDRQSEQLRHQGVPQEHDGQTGEDDGKYNKSGKARASSHSIFSHGYFFISG